MSKSVVFIDAGLDDVQTLVQSVAPGTEVVLLESGADGLAQMATWAETHSGYDSIAIVGHGTAGAQRIGGSQIDSASLNDSATLAALEKVGASLTAEGDLQLFGCNVAAGEAGEAFVRNLAAVTRADVAASSDITGFNGNWSLEYTQGDINAAAPFNPLSMNYGYDLSGTIGITSAWQSGTAIIVDATYSLDVNFDGRLYAVYNGTRYQMVSSFNSAWNGLTQDFGFEPGSLAAGNYPLRVEWDWTQYSASAPYTSITSGTVTATGSTWVTWSPNTAPTLTALDAATFAENLVNGAAQVIDSTVTFTDSDSANLDTGVMTISYSAGGGTEDQLSIASSGTISVSGTDVKSGTTTIGTVDGTLNGVNGAGLKITFNSSATPTLVDELIQAIAYQNTSNNPTGTRTISITVSDGDGATSTAATAVITVTSENDAPTGSDDSITATEDQDYTFTTSDFGSFTDPDTGASLQAVKIVSLPAAGTFTLNGVNVTAGQDIAVADITGNKLKWTPPANAYGASYATFTFKVGDGTDFDATARTLTINLSNVNDAPQIDSAAVTVSLADTTVVDTLSNQTGNITGSDPLDPAGTLTFTVNGNASQIGTYGTLAITSGGAYTYTPNNSAINALANGGSGTDNFTIRLSDGTANVTQAFTVNVSGANDSPVGVNDTLTVTEAGGHANASNGSNNAGGSSFTGNVISNDTDPDTGATRTITAIRTGNTEGAGTAGTIGQSLTGTYGALTQNSNGTYSYLLDNTNPDVQALLASGATLTETFNYTVTDDIGAADTAVLTITINGANDFTAATGIPASVTVIEDVASNLDLSMVTFSDVDHSSTSVRLVATQGALAASSGGGVTVTGSGTTGLILSGAIADINTFLTTVSNIQYTSATHDTGTPGASIAVQVDDGVSGYQQLTTINVNITPVNDAPAGTDKTVTIDEDATRTFSTADFGFTDVNDGQAPSTANVLLAVKITSLPLQGKIQLDGVDVSAGDFISVTDINANKLIFVPDAHENNKTTNPAAYASFTFQVQDDGDTIGADSQAATADDGVDLDPSPNTFTINVTPVNDAPVLENAGTSVPTLTSINEGNTTSAGNLISSLVRTVDGTNPTDDTKSVVTDVDFVTQGTTGGNPNERWDGGVAIYALTNDGPADGGTWEYNTGSGWTAVGVVTATSALLLRSSDSIRFVPDGLNATTATFSYYVWDGASGTQGNKVDVSTRGTTSAFSTTGDVATIVISAVNDAPVLNLDANSSSPATGNNYQTTFLPRGSEVAVVDADITITDVDKNDRTDTAQRDKISQAVIAIDASTAVDNLFGTTYETLTFKNGGVATASWSGLTITGNGTATVTITGVADWATYQTALQKVLYNNSNPNASTGNRTVNVTITDNDDTDVAAAHTNKLTATAATTIVVPWASVLDMNGTADGANYAATYTEDVTGTFVAASNATITNQGGTAIKNVVLSLSNPLDVDGSSVTQEKLFVDAALVTFLSGRGITVSGNNTHTLTLSASNAGAGVPSSDMQIALRGVQYYNASQAPNVTQRVINVTVEDIAMVGVPAQTTVTIIPVNDAPVISVNTAHSVLEGGLLTLGTANLNSTDVDDDQASLEFVVTNAPTKGVLFRDSNGNGAADSGEVLAAAAASGVITSFTQADLAAGIVKYQQTDTLTGPATDFGSDSFGFKVQDGMENAVVAPTATATINITGVNDAPTLTATASSPTFNENPGTAVALFNGASASTIETVQTVTQLVLTVAGVADGASEKLAIDGQSIALQTAASTGVGGTIAGLNYAIALVGTTATVTLTHAGLSTTEAQDLINGLAYQNTSNAPTGTSRVVTLTSIKDNGGTVNSGIDTTTVSITSTVTVVAEDTAPVLVTNAGKTVTNGALVTITTGDLNTTDTDTVTSALTYTVGSAPLKGTLFKDANSSGTVESGEALNATGTFTQADLAAGKIKYRHDGADNLADSFAFTVKDATTTLASANFTLSINAVTPTTPTVTGGGNTGGNSTDGSDVLFSGVVIAPPTGETVKSIQFTLIGVRDGNKEFVTINGQSVPMAATGGSPIVDSVDTDVQYAVVNNGGGSFTVTITDTTSSGWNGVDASAIVNGARYKNTEVPPTSGVRTATLDSVTDYLAGGGTGAPTPVSITSTITVATSTDLWTLAQAQTAVPTPSAPNDKIHTLNFTVTGAADGADEVMKINGHEIAMAVGTTTLDGVTYTVTTGGTAGTYTVAVSKDICWSEVEAEALLDGATYVNNKLPATTGSRSVTLDSVVEADSSNPGPGGYPTPAPSPTPGGSGSSSTVNLPVDLWTLADAQSAVPAPTGPNDRIQTMTFDITGAADGSSEVIHINGQDITLTAGATNVSGVTYTVTDNTGGSYTLVLTKTTCWTEAEAEAVLDGASYINNAATPTSGNRTVTLSSVTEAQYNGGTPIPAGTPTPAVSPNNSKEVPGDGGPVTYPTPPQTDTPLGAANLTVTPGSSIDALTFTVDGVKDGNSETLTVDGIVIPLVPTAAGALQTGSSGVKFTVTVTVDAYGKATVLIDTPDADPDAINYTEAQAETVVQTAVYANNANPATAGPRTVTLSNVREETGTGSPGGGTQTDVPPPNPGITGTKDVTGTTSTDPFSPPTDKLPDLDGDSNPNTGVTVDSITIGVTGIKDGANEIVNINGQAIPLVAGTQTINGYSYTVTIDGNGNAIVVLGTPNPTANFTEAEANAVIDGISYTNKANPPTPGARDISVNGIVKVTAGAPPVETPVPTPGINESIPVGTVTNTAPTVDTNATVNVAEGQTVTLSSSHVAASDAQQAAGSLVFKLVEAPANGAVFRDSNANGLVNAGETIALNGTFTQQEMLNGTIKYRHNGSETASDLLKFTVSDGIATTTAMPLVFAISRTNDQPALTATTATPSFTEGGASAALFSAATATTGDTLGTAQKFLTLVLTVSNLRDGSDETLLVNGANSIELSGATASGTAGMVNGSNLSYTVAKSGTTATVTLTHAGLTEAELKAVVESLQYENTSSNPTAGARGVTLTQLQDDGGTASGGIDTSPLAMTSTVTVAAANNAPTLVGTGFTVVEGSSFTLSTTQLAAADSDSALGSLVYTVTTAPAAGLLYLDNNGNSVNDSGDTTLALNSTFTQAELTSGKVRYQHDGSENADPNLAFSVSDGSAASSAQTVAVTRTAANDAPTLGNLDGDTITYPPANAAMLIDKDGNATVVDPDSTDFSGGTLRASIFFNGDPVKDVLSIKDIGTGAGQIGISTNNVSYAGTTIGTFTGGSSGADLVVTLNVNATPTAVSALISALQFYNSDTAPVNNSRGIRISLSDGDGGTSLASQVQVNIPVGGPAFLSGSGFYVSENTSLVTVMAASDAPAKMPITFGISPTVGGSNVDAAKFTINSSDGTLSFISAPDYESPTDSGGDNTYNVIVRASNTEGAYTEAALAVHIVDVTNESPGVTPGDTTGPVFGFATVNGNSLVITYTDASNLDATNLPAIGAFAVTNGGVANPVTAVAINASNKTVALTLTSAVNAGQVVTVAYTDPTSGNDTSAIQDAAGNDAPSIASIGVTNLTASSGGGTTGGGTTGGGTTGGGTTGGGTTTDTTGPNFSSAIVSGNSLVISLADNSNLDAANLPSTNAFTVLANGVSVPVQSITINATSKTVSLILQNNVLAGQSVTVSYSDPTASNDTAAIQDSLGNDMASLSAQTVVNLSSNSGPANSLPTGNVLIVGTLAEGQVLSALNTLADANGMGVVTYNWFAGGSLIGSGNTRTLSAAEVGKTITVSASYIDGLGTQESVSSLPTGVVSTAITPNRLPTGSVLISGTPLIGQQLVAGNTLADADGMGTVAYQWLANGVAVATGTSLTLSSNLLGSVISVRASYIDGAGKSETVTSAATSPVTGAPDAEIDIVDGSIVETVSNSSPSGLVTTIQAVAPITSTRQEDTSTTHDALADIPLAMDGNGIPLIQVGLPVGIGLAAEALSGGNLSLRQQLVNATNPRVSNDSTFAAIANDGIDRFVESVTDASQVTVRTITLNTAANVSTAPNQPIVITGATGTGENDPAHPARQEALVIDARNLPSGTVLTFNQVEFAIVIGAARIVGGDGSNFVVGDDAAQFIVLGADDDLLHGGDGDDVVGSKAGNDELHGDGGSDYLMGGLGDDRLDGGSGNDLLQGGQSDAGTWAFDMDKNGNISGYFTAAVPDLSESATMEVTAWRTGSGEPITSDERFAFSYQSGALVRDVALLYHAATGELPSVNELNLYSLSGMSSLQLGDLAYNYLVSHSPQVQSVEAQVNQLIELVWGHSDSALTAEGVQFINGGGTWAEGLLYLARHAEHANLLNDASGNLKLASDWVLSETGWSSDLGNDVLSGGEGNDVLVGGGGNNVIDGGAGIDLAVFFGSANDWLISVNEQQQLLVNNRAGNSQNVVTNMEFVQFGGVTYSLNGVQDRLSEVQKNPAEFLSLASTEEVQLIGFVDWINA